MPMLKRPAFGGVLLGLVFLWRSIYPTLMPRTWFNQAAITAICTAIGYGIGVLVGYIGHRILQHYDKEPPPSAKRTGWLILAGLGGLALLFALVFWPRWQNGQRSMLSMEHLSWFSVLPMLILGAALTAVLVLIGRAIALCLRKLYRFNIRHLPWLAARAVTVVVVLVVALLLSRNVLFDGFRDWANDRFSKVDGGTDEGIVQPSSQMVSGSPASLVSWESLGRQGRTFVATAQSLDALRTFHGADAKISEPIRVYVGLRSADSPEHRAALAVKELERTGAFDRDVLGVMTVTGTGFIDPPAATAIEQLHAGNTALVAMQYSFLPSWIAFITDKEQAHEAGSVLFHAVYEHWFELPKQSRPKLIVFGLSLGSFGAEGAFVGTDAQSSVANIVAKSDGALLVGPPNDSTIWRQLTADRDKGSPAWRPVYEGGKTVRFANRTDDILELDPGWASPRVLYFQHPSDPVVFWGFSDFLLRPDWMVRPRGYGVPRGGTWFPMVTGLQGVFDLMAGFGAPPGFGHDYTDAYLAAWAQVVPPDGWTSADTERLRSFLQRT